MAAVARPEGVCKLERSLRGGVSRGPKRYVRLALGAVGAYLARADESFLIEKVRGGDPDAFEELIRPFEGRLYQTILRIVRKPEDAADIYQETVLAAFEKIDTFAGGSSFGTWLHRIGVNCALMRVRSASREPVISKDDLPQFNWLGMHRERVAGWADSPEVQAQREELRRMLSEALDELAAVDRAVVWLKDVEGLSHDDIAAATGLSVSATRSRLHRARLVLRGRLERLLGKRS